ncbi:uncharacterized protein MYCFIDRAFT_210575 [Pseudocercospora fijiensis CIRAD86]|uniref:Uncharacterized protein n=1 Tax=Pseudocercospora fijiensis (strain CIRAD86) TaxID=383855 RepID=M2Z9Z4_PSEFD|nr:uncharacterized protein MYCFIDRAFT_210575 [Pseudocercospora fijiensis CIRAD86]EME86670.1 hypothetical protein MYCFIDRAFT_210575 [Pseudocercospora fijiensis CIRAD86]
MRCQTDLPACQRSIAEQSKDPLKSRPEIGRIWFFDDIAQILPVLVRLALKVNHQSSEVFPRILEYQEEEAPPYRINTDDVYTSHRNPSMNGRAKDDRHCKDRETIMRDNRWRDQEAYRKQELRDEVRNALWSRDDGVYELQIGWEEGGLKSVPAAEREHRPSCKPWIRCLPVDLISLAV